MSMLIEDTAKTWLTDPSWQKVFKHTFDVVMDYVCYAMMATGALALSVKFITALGSGDVLCIIMGVSNSSLSRELGQYPSGNTFPIVNYANFNYRCVDSALSHFMQYGPYFYLLQTLLLILVEKFSLKIPRVAGKIERFYVNIVEESLFGKDPDVAEDVCDVKSNSDAISRQRRRNEVCMSLKRSSVIHKTYVAKNIVEMILLAFFIPLNLFYGIQSHDNMEPALCVLDMKEIPEINLGPGSITLQCEAKKVRFFLITLHIIICTQICCFLCCAGSLLWCLGFRSISRLLRSIENVCFEYEVQMEKLEGEDFLFLFDLLAHTSGIESTLRVLTHSDNTFRMICQPRVKGDGDHLKVEEDKMKVTWHAAAIEKFLADDITSDICVDSYDVTIYPAESIKNSVTKRAKLRETPGADDVYSAWFFDLAGGKTEYIITIACVIGRSRMKGERIVTTLLPYGPEKPRAGMLKVAMMTEVEISWEPPKGEFTKYVLAVQECDTPAFKPRTRLLTLLSQHSNNSFSTGSLPDSSGDLRQHKGYRERELSNKLTNFTVAGLSPGETYGIQLKTKTGDRETRNAIFETVLTKPGPVNSLGLEDIGTEQATVKWVAPEGHSRLRAFNLLITSKDNKDRKEMAVKHNPNIPVNSFVLEHLQPATEFNVTVTTVCVFEMLKTLSEEETTTFITLPPQPKNMELESRFPNSLTVSWDAPAIMVTNQKYKMYIQAPDIGYNNQYEMVGERRTFNFSKLPEIIGTGEFYTIRIVYSVVPLGSDDEVDSEALVGTFVTKPLAPSNFRLGSQPNEIMWTKSPTPRVNGYKIRYKAVEEGSKPEELFLPNPEENEPCSVILEDLLCDVMYRVNVYALVDGENNEVVESKELHEKIINNSGSVMLYNEELDKKEGGTDTDELTKYYLDENQ